MMESAHGLSELWKKIEKNGLCPHRQNTEDCVSKQDRIADYSIILVIINILCLHATKQIY